MNKRTFLVGGLELIGGAIVAFGMMATAPFEWYLEMVAVVLGIAAMAVGLRTMVMSAVREEA